MANNFNGSTVDGNRTFASDDVAGTHYPLGKLAFGNNSVAVRVSEENPLPVDMAGVATQATLASLLTATNAITAAVQALLTNDQLRATEVPTTLLAPEAAFWPGYTAPGGDAMVAAGIDPSGGLSTRAAVLTDEGTFRVNFANTSLAVSIGAVTVAGSIVTGTGFLDSAANLKDFFKLDVDGESSWTQISRVLSDTEIALVADYVGGTTGAASRSLVKPVTSGGATIAVANGACTIATGTTSGASAAVERLVDYGPLVYRGRLSVSQRIANQSIRIGLVDHNPLERYFARFRLEGTLANVVICETARNPTTSPSVAETEVTTLTLPWLNTVQGQDYRVELLTESVRFYIGKTMVAEHTKTMPSPFDMMEAGVRALNTGTAASNTNVAIDYLTTKNHNKLEIGVMSDAEAILANQAPLLAQLYSQAGAITLNTDLMVIDCSQLRSVLLQCSAMGTGGVVTGAWSNDGVNYPVNAVLKTAAGADVATFNAAGMWATNVFGRYLRLRLTTAATAGTTTLNVQGSQFPVAQPPTQPISGSVTASGTMTANQGTLVTPSAANINSAASTNLNFAKNSAGTVYNASAFNAGAGPAYVKLYNKASAPVLATDVPILVLVCPAGGNFDHDFGIIGHRFTTGIAYAITGGVADTDTTAVAASQVKAILSYL